MEEVWNTALPPESWMASVLSAATVCVACGAEVIDRHFPLEELVEAFRYQESGRHFGKIVIDI